MELQFVHGFFAIHDGVYFLEIGGVFGDIIINVGNRLNLHGSIFKLVFVFEVEEGDLPDFEGWFTD